MKYTIAFLLLSLLLISSACKRQSKVCPEDSITYFSDPSSLPLMSSSDQSEPLMTPVFVEIKGKMTEVDRLIRGPICTDTWSGTIYVACDIQIKEWQDAPDFFEECPLTIEPNTKIYVAAHNDTAYYKGCSCHSGELVSP